MSPVLKRKREKFRLPSKYLLFILTLLCIAMMVLSFTTNFLALPLNYVSSFLLVPFEEGLTSVGTYALEKTQQLEELSSVLQENERLKNQINELTIENTRLQQEKYELTKLRELYELDAEYEEYTKIGARIISRDASNWYSSFVIDKGTEDGIQVNCNVIAGSVELMMPSNHLILFCPLLLLPSISPASGPFLVSQFFTSGGQSIGVCASASVLPMTCPKVRQLFHLVSQYNGSHFTVV